MNFSTKKLIIFDFDGTIADTAEVFVQTNNRNYKQYGTKFVSHEDVAALKKMGDRQALSFLGINMLEFLLISRRFLKDIHAFMPSAPIYTGMKELLELLHKNGKMTPIVSRNSVKNIQSFMHANNINHIHEVYSEKVFSKKPTIINGILKKHKLSTHEAIFIGDRLSDLYAAQKVGIDFIFVSWGYGDASKVPQNELKYIANTPQDLKKLLES